LTPFYVGRHFATVDGKHLPADQAQVITDKQYIPEQMDDLFIHGGNEFGNGGEMGPGISGQGHEDHVFMAGLFNLPAGDDVSGVSVEYNLEQDFGIVGSSSGDVVLETFVKVGEVQLMINEMAQGVFESAGEDLLRKVNGNKFALGIGVRFVTSHAAISL
jgi:hypothetical protein